MSAALPVCKKVLVIQQVLKQYRLALFEQLAQQLVRDGIELTLCFSLPSAKEVTKGDNLSSPPAAYAKLVPLKTFGPLVWQAVPEVTGYDLVIVEQANRHLVNYLLLLRRRWRPAPKVICWGHGFNHQASPGLGSALKQRFKTTLLRYSDGFFAYTQQVADFAIKQGIPAARITVLNNSIDTAQFATRVQQLRQQFARQSHQAGSVQSTQNSRVQSKQRPTLIFCGALYPDKQIALLLQTAEQLAKQHLIQKLIVLGDGPDRPLIEAEVAAQFAANVANSQDIWLDYRGACFGDDKAAAYAEADLVLNPGLVGLAILDAFAAGLPLITTRYAGHSPEISYLQHGLNGLMVEQSDLLPTLRQLLQAPQQLQALAEGARQSSTQYSLTAMVQAFAGGVRRTLEQP